MATDDDGGDLIEMSGKIVEWNGRTGFVQTDCGLRLEVGRRLLTALGFRGAVADGDRIHFHVFKHVEVTYHIDRVRLIIPSAYGHKPTKRKSPRPRNAPPSAAKQIVTGVIEAFDAEKGYGYVETTCGESILVHITCLRASGYRTAPIGVKLSFEALQRPKGWHAIRVLPRIISN